MLFDAFRRMFGRRPLPPELASPAVPAGGPSGPAERGSRALARGRYDEAIVAFTEALDAIQAGPLADEEDAAALARAFAYNKRGVARIASGRRDEALADFVDALEARAAFAPALVNLGNLLLEEGALDDAVEHYEAAMRADAAYAPAYRNLAIARRRAGDYAGSVRNLRRAVKLESTARGERTHPTDSDRA